MPSPSVSSDIAIMHWLLTNDATAHGSSESGQSVSVRQQPRIARVPHTFPSMHTGSTYGFALSPGQSASVMQYLSVGS
jgi:hypothetical protein